MIGWCGIAMMGCLGYLDIDALIMLLLCDVISASWMYVNGCHDRCMLGFWDNKSFCMLNAR